MCANVRRWGGALARDGGRRGGVGRRAHARQREAAAGGRRTDGGRSHGGEDAGGGEEEGDVPEDQRLTSSTNPRTAWTEGDGDGGEELGEVRPARMKKRAARATRGSPARFRGRGGRGRHGGARPRLRFGRGGAERRRRARPGGGNGEAREGEIGRPDPEITGGKEGGG